jgi:hypothetical protein
MNTLVVLRQRELASLDQFRSGFTQFLGSNFLREQWMSIYKENKKIGYVGYRFEKVFALERVEIHSTLESKVKIDLLGLERWIEVDGTLLADQEMHPISLRLDLGIEGQPLAALVGRREEGKLALSLRTGGKSLKIASVPLGELHLGNTLVPTIPMAGFKVGDSYKVSCFDPLTFRPEMIKVEVTSQEARDIDGLPVDAYCLESTFRGVKNKSWVTDAGELIRQELGPPFENIVLRQDDAIVAKRINTK